MNRYLNEKQRMIRILLIEDDANQTSHMRDILGRENFHNFDVECTATLKGGVERLAKGDIDVVLLDLALRDAGGMSGFYHLHSEHAAVPIVVLSDLLSEDKAKELVKQGAHDYWLKVGMDEELLWRAVRYAYERRKSEEALQRAYAQTETLLASITSILIGVNQNRVVTHYNPVAETTFGVAASEVLGKALRECDIRWDAGKVEVGITDCCKAGHPVRVEDVQFLRSSGEPGLLGLTIIPVRGQNNGDLDYVIFGADITQRRQLEQMKDEFVSTVSHELRTPLTIIREGVAQVHEGILGQINGRQARYLEMALQGIDRLGRVVDELLDISKIEAHRVRLRRECVNIVTLAQQVARDFEPHARKRGLEIRTHFDDKKIEAFADRDKIVQIFMNLTNNAMKFTEKGFIEVSVKDLGTIVECSVTDTGFGIAPQDLPNVFRKFFQFGRDAGPGAKGTGLGLAICKGLVELHHGKIWAESELGAGSKFAFHLPKTVRKGPDEE